jgi:CheY-like chemotaxis protein
MKQLQETHRWLRDIGAEPEFAEEGSILEFPVEGEDHHALAIMFDPNKVVLPSAGPLTGMPLPNYSSRVLEVESGIVSSLDLSIQISTRTSELAREKTIRDDRDRYAAMLRDPALGTLPTAGRRNPTVLLVGPLLAQQRMCAESLRLRGYNVTIAKSEQDALEVFNSSSPELVLADMNLGRSEGLDLILSMQQVYGIEKLPVVLVDEAHRAAKREAARSLGAAGYLTYPLDVPKIAKQLTRLIEDPKRRRFVRYPNRLPLTMPGSNGSSILTALSRGGLFVATDRDLPLNSLLALDLKLPHIDHNVYVQAEVVYHLSGPGRVLNGLGMRFHQLEKTQEELLLRYLRSLEGR